MLGQSQDYTEKSLEDFCMSQYVAARGAGGEVVGSQIRPTWILFFTGLIHFKKSPFTHLEKLNALRKYDGY